jgi:3-hydroxy acid dehydrogenase / malonic semialdehyde reductase
MVVKQKGREFMPIVFITGATSGFGAACVRLFAGNGWRVVATGRRSDLLEGLARELPRDLIHTVELDVRDRAAVERVAAELPVSHAEIDVLVNNAGLALGLDPAHRASLDDWEVMVDTNVKGLMYCTRALLPGMVERNRGHVVNLGSIAGSYPYPGGNVYGATKAFVKQFTLNLKADLVGTRVRVTDIEPGMAETAFSVTRFHGDCVMASQVYAGMTPLSAEDIAESIFWVVTRPPRVTISRLEIWPTDQGFSPLAVCRKS